MIERIKKEIEYLDFEIEEHRRSLYREVERFKKAVAAADAYQIAAITQDHVFQNIQSDICFIRRYDEQKRVLVRLLKEEATE